jgi:hypothetical protein
MKAWKSTQLLHYSHWIACSYNPLASNLYLTVTEYLSAETAAHETVLLPLTCQGSVISRHLTLPLLSATQNLRQESSSRKISIAIFFCFLYWIQILANIYYACERPCAWCNYRPVVTFIRCWALHYVRELLCFCCTPLLLQNANSLSVTSRSVSYCINRHSSIDESV